WAAAEAKLEDGDWHAKRLGSEIDPYQSVISQLLSGSARAEKPRANGDMFTYAARAQAQMSAQTVMDLERLTAGKGVQAYCLECPSASVPPAQASTAAPASMWQVLGALFAR
ncbi:MAG: hypothetical protein ABJJ48_00150, partial [Marinomonas sp.]